ncbi:MAG TPA: hypothetical protein VGD62_09510, partial [Acidobacteriaceae bacterium]
MVNRSSLAVCCFSTAFLAAMVLPAQGRAQVFIVTSEQYEARFLAFTPTNVALPTRPASEHTRMNLERALESEQGFAMRPLPLSTKGLTLHANGELAPR